MDRMRLPLIKRPMLAEHDTICYDVRWLDVNDMLVNHFIVPTARSQNRLEGVHCS